MGSPPNHSAGYRLASLREAQVLATGPTISASRDQTCSWCHGAVAATEPITYARESGWCHESCTTRDPGATGHDPD